MSEHGLRVIPTSRRSIRNSSRRSKKRRFRRAKRILIQRRMRSIAAEARVNALFALTLEEVSAGALKAANDLPITGPRTLGPALKPCSWKGGGDFLEEV